VFICVISIASVAIEGSMGYNEGNPKWEYLREVKRRWLQGDISRTYFANGSIK